MKQTTLEGRVENGKLIGLKVTPESRRKDVIIGAEWNPPVPLSELKKSTSNPT